MYALYKVEVWVRADIEPGTSLKEIKQELDDLIIGNSELVCDENYITSTEQHIENSDIKIFDNNDNLIYSKNGSKN